ncbi:MAG: hypothetical protein HOI95_06740 [Chromatiales bacterium]|jgi:hypothetical protein|nr:hypothetical protein [Chromatiales bacterium]
MDNRVKVVPESVSDSTVTSLYRLMTDIPDDRLANHIEEQVVILEEANVNLEKAAAYYSGLLHDRDAFQRLGADYNHPSSTDYMRLRLVALYHMGLVSRR